MRHTIVKATTNLGRVIGVGRYHKDDKALAKGTVALEIRVARNESQLPDARQISGRTYTSVYTLSVIFRVIRKHK
jgi:hypothetical protein